MNTMNMDVPRIDFSTALIRLRQGDRIARAGWNGKGMYLRLVVRAEFTFRDGEPWVPSLPFIAMYTAQGEFVPWLASQTDILADDWVPACVFPKAVELGHEPDGIVG